MQILEILARAADVKNPQGYLPEIRELVRKRHRELSSGCVPLEKLIIRQTVSKKITDYRAPVPAFSALEQLESAGRTLRLGQTVRLIYTLGMPRAHAWDAPDKLDPRRVDVHRYRRLLDRAVDTVMRPITNGDAFWLTGVKQLAYEMNHP
jgi:DNA polymerase elongation subunit (family B)